MGTFGRRLRRAYEGEIKSLEETDSQHPSNTALFMKYEDHVCRFFFYTCHFEFMLNIIVQSGMCLGIAELSRVLTVFGNRLCSCS